MNSDNNNASCGCGHYHQHKHEEGCSCGCEHHRHHGEPPSYEIFEDGKLSEKAIRFMHLLESHKFLPCARFIITSSVEPSFFNIALAPVFISDKEESVSLLKETGSVLLGLERHGYISIDYGVLLTNFDYSYFKESAAYKLFEETVSDAKQQQGFLGDTAVIEFGSIAPLDETI